MLFKSQAVTEQQLRAERPTGAADSAGGTGALLGLRAEHSTVTVHGRHTYVSGVDATRSIYFVSVLGWFYSKLPLLCPHGVAEGSYSLAFHASGHILADPHWYPQKSPLEPDQTVPWLMCKALEELEVFLNWVTGKDFMSVTELCMWLNFSCCPKRLMGETQAKHLKQTPNPNCAGEAVAAALLVPVN